MDKTFECKDKNIKEPFHNEDENKKFKDFYHNYINKNLNEIVLSTDVDIMKYIEIVVSALLLEINKTFPEPNYSIYMTYRIKSPKSNIEKLADYVRRLEIDGSSISIKDITDLIGLRIIIEKIPYNISISKNNPDYETFNKLADERKANIKISKQFHNFESKILDNNCTCIEYYTQSKNILKSILDTFESETSYSPNYAIALKEKYNKLIDECEKKIQILTALGDYSTKMDTDFLINESKIDFLQFLKDFDARIDSKLGLKLYSNALPHIINNSNLLRELGVSISSDDSRIKHKREKSGYVADFTGLDFNGISIKAELQSMYTNEHLESITGYSAHSNMPGKEAYFMEVPSAYVNRNISLLSDIGKSDFISNDELRIINKISNLKNISNSYSKLFKELSSPNNITFSDNIPTGVSINPKYLDNLKSFCTLKRKELANLKDNLYNEGCNIYDAWAKNISAIHATARLDKDSSAKNRVKIHYDNAYECLAHTIREQIKNPNSKLIDAEYYLKQVYKYQNEWLKNTGLMATESSIIDFEITEYTKNDLPKLLTGVSKKLNDNNDEIEK